MYTPSPPTAYTATEAVAPSLDSASPSVNDTTFVAPSAMLDGADSDVPLGWNANARSADTCPPCDADDTLNTRPTPPKDSAAQPAPTPCTTRVARV